MILLEVLIELHVFASLVAVQKWYKYKPILFLLEQNTLRNFNTVPHVNQTVPFCANASLQWLCMRSSPWSAYQYSSHGDLWFSKATEIYNALLRRSRTNIPSKGIAKDKIYVVSDRKQVKKCLCQTTSKRFWSFVVSASGSGWKANKLLTRYDSWNAWFVVLRYIDVMKSYEDRSDHLWR